MSFTSLASAWLFALLIPIIVFYFLKLRRPRMEVPSLVLWRQVLADQRVNSPFQRFKRHLLLLLQLLILALLALAAMQPFLRRGAARADRQVLLIDISASMAALDREGGRSRLDEAREKARAIVAVLLPGQELSLIAFSRHARRLTAFTDDRRDLRAALDALEVEDLPSDLEEALRTAQALARSASFDRVTLLSDGNFPAQTNFELPFAIDFQRLGPAGPNLGITALEARRTLGGKWTVFAQIESSNPDASGGTLELLQDGAVLARETIAPAASGGQRLTFSIPGEGDAALQLVLRPTAFDALPSDNTAWLRLPAARPLQIYVAPRLASYRHALATLAGLAIFPRDDTSELPAAFDLVLSDDEADLARPARVSCGIGVIPAELQPLLTVGPKSTLPIDWRRDSALLQHVSLADVIFTEEAALAPSVDDGKLANLGYDIIAHSAHGPLIVIRDEPATLRVNLLLHTDRSTLPYRVGFPILVANLVQTAMHRAGLAEATAVRTGVLPALPLQADASYRVADPRGGIRTETAAAAGELSGSPALRVGEYTITGPATAGLHIGVSLLAPSETTLAAVDEILFRDRLTVPAATSTPRTDTPLWWPLTAAGFVLLLVEWWWFQRPRRVA